MVAPGESARSRKIAPFGPSPAWARVVSLRYAPLRVPTRRYPSYGPRENRTGLKLPSSRAGRHQSSRSSVMHTHQKSSDPVATIGIDIGKNTFHLVGFDKRGTIAMRTKVSRNQLIRRLVNLPACLVGLEAGSGSHHIARQIQSLGHDVRLIPAQYVKPFLNETATYCPPTRDRAADYLSVSSAVRGDRGHFKAIRL